MKSGILACVVLATIWNGAALAQGAPIKLADVAELSGGGATVGTNWKNGIDLAVEEINAKGGILGRKMEVTHADSQSNPGVARAQVQKALDSEPYVLLGPGYSGSVKVTRAARRRSRHRPDHGRRGRRTDAEPATSSCSAPRSASNRPCRRSPNTSTTRSRPRRSRSSGSTTISARAAATSSPRNSRATASRSWPTVDRGRPGRFRRRRRQDQGRRRPTRFSSTSMRKRARVSSKN